MTLSILTLRIMTFSIMKLSITTFNILKLSIMTPTITTFSITKLKAYAKFHCKERLLIRVTIKTIMLSVVMLNVGAQL
jgi:hypothetical protein